MSDDRNWFLVDRSEAHAFLLLTSRPDLLIRKDDDRSEGTRFMVTIKEPTNGVPTKMFVVEVRGTMSDDQKDWSEPLHQFYVAGREYFLPVCAFVVNVRTREAGFTWIAEPDVKGETFGLSFFDHPEFHPLDEQALDAIIRKVQSWYGAMPRSLALHAS